MFKDSVLPGDQRNKGKISDVIREHETVLEITETKQKDKDVISHYTHVVTVEIDVADESNSKLFDLISRIKRWIWKYRNTYSLY